MKNTLLPYLKEHGKPPVDYILSRFADHDIVLLGEMHRVKQQLDVYHQLIPRLPEVGVTVLAYEFARREDQPLIDALMDKPVFDVSLAKLIMIRQEALWGFAEYLEVFRIVWSVNKELPPSQRIRLIGLNDPYNWKLYNHICQTELRKPNKEEIALIWKDCDERYWADTIAQHYIPGKTKVLGIMGSHHAFTRYREPDYITDGGTKVFVRFNKPRFGNHLHARYADKVYNICFYDPWESKSDPGTQVHPARGVIEQVINPHYRQIGFDLLNSPLGQLPDDSFYSLGYPDFRISMMFDGMIYTGRIQDLKPVSPIQNFIDAENIATFRDYAAFNMEADKDITQINSIIQADAKL
jgi:hypothetical protein